MRHGEEEALLREVASDVQVEAVFQEAPEMNENSSNIHEMNE